MTNLNDIQRRILNVKPQRTEGFKRHLSKGGTIETYLPFLLGDGYGEFWKTRKRYRVVKGSRASKKTVTTARNYIYNMMKHPEANLVVVRKVHRTNRDSTYKELKKACKDLGVDKEWTFTTSPLEMTVKATGQKIMFRGMDDPMKISGIAVEVGYLCWAWVEEAYELKEKEELDFLDESLRGLLPDDLWYQITLTLNPWNKRHWIKENFFDPIYGVNEEYLDNPKDDPMIFAITTNYMLNEFIDDGFKQKMERLRVSNPKRYNVAGRGNWGASEGVIFEKWDELDFDPKVIMRKRNTTHFCGLDFGWTDPVAFVAGIVDHDNMIIYIYDEIYKQKLSNRELVTMIKKMQLQNSKIIAENANPKDIEDLYRMGLMRIHKADKGAGSILRGIRDIQDYMVYVHPKCENFQMELENYLWNKAKPDTPIDDFNHLMDAWRYGMEQINQREKHSSKHRAVKFK